ncbi:putative cysteine-rich receptor-like protein kinase 31 [Morella rubra]|uniref:non-specific serine/threonine protein kinase n=2 Tax=Morella rubra TaxID=262757 RepID=A0A6A1VG43_9ROSI|nr:putative cysteine-rich receptor-like protein kinase 31 [Morella rubra]
MTYDYYGPLWSSITGAHAALYDPSRNANTDYGVGAWIHRGLSASKLVMALPFYDYAWILKNPNDSEIGAPATGPAITDDGTNSYIVELSAQEDSNKRQPKWRLLVIVLTTTPVILVLGLVITIARRRMLKSKGIVDRIKESESKLIVNRMAAAGDFNSDDPNLQVYSLAEIEAATDKLSIKNKLGQGGYGPVYKGILPNGQEIAVKKLSQASTQGFEEFQNEVTLTAKLQHVNLVRVLGFCIQRDEKMLIYEYMPNKSLDFYLFDPVRWYLLDWRNNIDIIEGVTQGLLYLQEYSRMTIIHRDLKPSNILLDGEMKANISDFGMARNFTKDKHEANTGRIVGTYGYVPHEYIRNGVYSIKSDIYSFGILLLQIIGGERNACYYGPDEKLNLLEYNSFHRVPVHESSVMLLLGQQTRIDFPLYMFELIMDEAWGIKEYSLPYGVFLTQFLISRGVVIAADTRARGQEGALTRRFARRAAAAEEASRPSTSASEAPLETGAPAVPPPWVAQLFADLDSRVSATVKATLQPVERQMQSLEEQLKELRTAFDGECTVTMLRNKSVVAHMADVNEQLEEIKKTLDDFKTEADPQRIPGDIPDDVATFRDAVRR